MNGREAARHFRQCLRLHSRFEIGDKNLLVRGVWPIADSGFFTTSELLALSWLESVRPEVLAVGLGRNEFMTTDDDDDDVCFDGKRVAELTVALTALPMMPAMPRDGVLDEARATLALTSPRDGAAFRMTCILRSLLPVAIWL